MNGSRSLLIVLCAATLFVRVASAQLNLPAPASGCTPFIPATFYLENSNASNLVTGDFNGDGILDFAAYTQSASNKPTLTILLGQKNGRLIAGQSYSIGSNTVGLPLAVGDFNGDGKLDVVTANGSAIVVFLGNGDGTFQPGKETPVSLGPIGIAVGDFNEDGKLDIAVAQFNSVSDIQVMLGNGDGTFQAPVNYPVTSYPTAVAVADYNHDGHLDLAVTNGGAQAGYTVSVLFGNGDGTFGPKTDYEIGIGPFDIVAADFNGDGSMDLATSNYTSGNVSVLLNKGDGTFLAARNYVASHPFAPYRIAAAPLRPRSEPSLAVATIAGTYILVNKGDGTFEFARGYEPVSTGVVLTDLNGDGKTDLVVAGGFHDDGGSLGVTTILGDGHGGFASPGADVAAPDIIGITVADFNGDSIPDLAATGENGPLAILIGQGDGRFSLPVFYNDLGTELGYLASGDFNGDGKIDLAVTDHTDAHPRVQIMLGNGDGTFTKGRTHLIPPVFPGLPWVTVADFRGNGILDIAASGSSEVEILLGRGDGTFISKGVYPGTGELAVGDFNGDGKLDFAAVNPTNSGISIYLGNGDGKFTNVANYPVSFFANAITTGDFNGDGNLDLVVNASPRDGYGNVQVFLGNGDGTFQSGASFIAGYTALAADFNGDGKVDLAVVSLQGLLQIFLGNGDGTFTASESSSLGQYAGFFVTADLTRNDTMPDLIVPDYLGGEVSVLLNQCRSLQ
jgi:hypothetical protein